MMTVELHGCILRSKVRQPPPPAPSSNAPHMRPRRVEGPPSRTAGRRMLRWRPRVESKNGGAWQKVRRVRNARQVFPSFASASLVLRVYCLRSFITSFFLHCLHNLRSDFVLQRETDCPHKHVSFVAVAGRLHVLFIRI